MYRVDRDRVEKVFYYIPFVLFGFLDYVNEGKVPYLNCNSNTKTI